ncbi:MAG: NAD-dependent deacylase [Chloroflexi bacterium]|nr:NAD-dependent deacylase [Chloroflexota bacterium]
MGTVPNKELEQAARLIADAQYVVALIGAGLSVESGIPPFRGPGGLWTRYGEPDMRGYQRFVASPKAWWEKQLFDPEPYRAELNQALERARPNPGHYALAEMERMGVLKHIITQNVDNLHRLAGSKAIAEIHGNRTRLRCIGCGARFERSAFPINPRRLPPECPECGGVVKGDGVMFGEPIPPDVLRVCEEQTLLCDCMLLVGTSGVVYPAAGFPSIARSKGAALVEVNPYDTPLSPLCDVRLRGPSGDILPQVVEQVARLRQGPAEARKIPS